MAWEIVYAVQKRLHWMLWLEEKVLISRNFSMKKINTSDCFLFLMISHFSLPPTPQHPPPFLAPPHLYYLSLFFRSSSTLSANSCLSVAPKWLCLADSTDKRLNACCPHWKTRGEGSENRGTRWKNWEMIGMTIAISVFEKSTWIFVLSLN